MASDGIQTLVYATLPTGDLLLQKLASGSYRVRWIAGDARDEHVEDIDGAIVAFNRRVDAEVLGARALDPAVSLAARAVRRALDRRPGPIGTDAHAIAHTVRRHWGDEAGEVLERAAALARGVV